MQNQELLKTTIFSTDQTQPPKKAEDADLNLNASQQQLKEHIRKRIASRGARGLMGIAKKFKIADDNGNGLLDVEEFKNAMHDFRMGLSVQ